MNSADFLELARFVLKIGCKIKVIAHRQHGLGNARRAAKGGPSRVAGAELGCVVRLAIDRVHRTSKLVGVPPAPLP
jgi:hypothetical protein